MNYERTISLFDLTFNHNKKTIEIRSQIQMQFVPVPLVSLLGPTYLPLSVTQMIRFALAIDFKKFVLVSNLNELSSLEKDQKKSQNTQTTITLSSLEQIIPGKTEPKDLQPTEKNKKQQHSQQDKNKHPQKSLICPPKKRQSYERARCQISQALDSLSEILPEQEKFSNEAKQEEIALKNKIESKNQSLNQVPIKILKKIKKRKDFQKVAKNTGEEPHFQISVTVSLIDTIDHPKINIDRFEIQRKKQNLLARAIVYEDLQQKKYGYQIRERRELKKLN